MSQKQTHEPAKNEKPANKVTAGSEWLPVSGSGIQSMLHLQQTAGNRAVQRLLASGRLPPRADITAVTLSHAIQRDDNSLPDTTAGAPGPVAPPLQATQRAAAETTLRDRWGVADIRAGSQADQAAAMQHARRQYFGDQPAPANLEEMLAQAGWQQWAPADDAPLWRDLVNAFTHFAQIFGGVPHVNRIIFFYRNFRYVAQSPAGPCLQPLHLSAAEYGGDTLTIFAPAEYLGVSRALVDERSRPQQPSPVSGTPLEMTLLHELGHGLVETVLGGIDSNMLRNYGREAGWFQGRLYDAGVEDVRQAIAGNQAPADSHRITAENWNDGRWQEQPISIYTLSGLHEDFPEAVAAFVVRPGLLQARSPSRHSFLTGLLSNHRAALQQALRRGNPAAAPNGGT
jgi:hypothetical protein